EIALRSDGEIAGTVEAGSDRGAVVTAEAGLAGAGERSDGGGGEVNGADAVVVAVGDVEDAVVVKDAAAGVGVGAVAPRELGGCGGASIAGLAFLASAREGVHYVAGVDDADALVELVDDVEVAFVV